MCCWNDVAVDICRLTSAFDRVRSSFSPVYVCLTLCVCLVRSADEELITPQKLETGDTVKMKQAMDEAVIKAVSGPTYPSLTYLPTYQL